MYEERRKESLRTLQDTEGRRQRINELVSSCKLHFVSARQCSAAAAVAAETEITKAPRLDLRLVDDSCL